MKSRSFCNLRPPRQATKYVHRCGLAAALSTFWVMGVPGPARANDAPQWMHALVNVPLPAHDEKTDAVLLYSEEILSVQGNGKMKRTERRVFKILRPDGRKYGRVFADFDSETKINSIHGWCIPAQGKDYEVKDKDALETALFGVQNGELMTDLKTKVLTIPAADPGSIIGYEIEQEVRPYVMQDVWAFQRAETPVREAHYTLQLPAGWEYKAVWLNYSKAEPSAAGSNQWQWIVKDVEGIRPEYDMPPREGVAGQMIVSLFPPGGSQNKGFENWTDMGRWEDGLEQGRREASAEIKQKVVELTAGKAAQLEKMRALAQFVQRDIRYVAIQLGIGGWQPHPAPQIFTHKYGDCKDKATILSTMLKEIGVTSYYVSVNTERGTVTPATPATRWFNHEILAIRLPDGMEDSSLMAVLPHAKLGRLLIFDPTDDMTPLGQLRGALQANYALLVSPEGGELVELPKLPALLNGVQRTAKLTLNPTGTLSGDVREVRVGDRAAAQRAALRSVTKDADRIKPVESLLANSLTTYYLTKASVTNLNMTDQPFIFDYSLVAQNYAKTAGNLLLVRPRVLGNKSSGLLETKEPRKYPVEFEGPSRDTDTFEITLPQGYEVDDLPPPIHAEYSFASYESKTETTGNVLRYTRTFEVKETSVPLSKVEDLKKLYRIIAGDERNTAVLKPAGH
ncbi:MAG: DUF3857 and transglutaminase domain-containing protein [Candidatus Acidiferrum sp.]